MIPIGLIIRLIEQLLNKTAPANEHANLEDRLHHAAILRTAAVRLGAVFNDYGQRMVLVFGTTRVEVKFMMAERAIRQMAWAVSGPPPGFPVFRLVKRGPFAFARRNAPRGTIARLENTYLVQTNDPESVRLLWTDEVCEGLARMSSRAEVTSDGVTFEVTCPSTGHPDVVDAGVRLCLALARSDVYGARLLRELPEGTFVEHQLPFVNLPGPGQVQIGYAREKDVIVTRARAAIGEVTETTAAAASRLGATAAMDKGELVISWPTVVRDKQRLLEVVELMRAAATSRDGIFR